MNDIMHFDKPAEDFNSALPLGNGRLGLMVYGEVEKECVSINEDTCWYGKPMKRENENSAENLEKVRELIFEGKIQEAEELMSVSFFSSNPIQRHYEPCAFFSTEYKYDNEECVSDYSRDLDMSKAIATVSFKKGDVQYKREYFVSYPEQVIIIINEADTKGSISYVQRLDRKLFSDAIYAVDNNTIAIEADTSGVELSCYVKTVSTDGEVSTIGSSIVVKNATKTITYISANTTYYQKNIRDISLCLKKSLKDIVNSEKYEINDLKQRHIEDFSELYERVSIEIDNGKVIDENETIDKRIKNYSLNNEDLPLISTFINFGRYLMISGSRKGSLPLNLQGIWNELFLPPWDSKFTTNINVEMNYWMAEKCDLYECHDVLFDFMRKLYVNGKETAKKTYSCRGWCLHHNSDLWADTAIHGEFFPASFWCMGSAWLCLHLIEHYDYSQDKTFALEFYEIIKEACLFYVDFMVEHNGFYVTCPSSSPENTYLIGENNYNCSLSYGVTADVEILNELFNGFIKISDVLAIENEVVVSAKNILSKLPPLKVGKHGQLCEWIEDYTEVEPSHRHKSHLFGLHPGTMIDIDKTPELAKACERVLERKRELVSGDGIGWSRAWNFNFLSRLKKPEDLRVAISEFIPESLMPNMFGNIFSSKILPYRGIRFQIEQNFGAVSGLIEMLVQSHTGTIKLLPALPKTFLNGEVKGIKAKGGFTLNFKWVDCKVVFCEVFSVQDAEIDIVINGVAINKRVSKNKWCEIA